MINKMREMAPIIMLIILVTFVGGTVFLNWGMNVTSRLSNRATVAGKINGREVPITYFERLVNQERSKMKDNANSDQEQAQYRLVPQQVWEREVQKALTGDAFKKMSIGASADEVFEYIKRNPLPGIDTVSVFMTNGVFDTSKYGRFLSQPENYNNYPWLREIESYTQDVIVPTQKLEMLLGAAAAPDRAEIAYQYRQMKDRGVFEYAKVNNQNFKVDSTKITEARVRKYYAAHEDTFYAGEPMAELYFAKLPKVATAQDEKQILQDLIDLKKNIKSSQDFAEQAKVESDDEGTAENGGDLGWFARGQMVPQFDSVAFSIDTGKISDPVKTQFGYHLILVEKREMKDGVLKVKARHILRKIAPSVETLDALSERMDSLRIKMNDNGFAAAAKSEPGIVFDSTALFKRGDPIPGLGYVAGAAAYTFTNDKNEISDRLENPAGFYLFSIKRVIKKGTLPFDVVKPQIVKILADSLRREATKEYAQQLVSKIPGIASLSKLEQLDSTKIISGKTDTITPAGYVAAIGFNSKPVAVGFSLPVGKVSSPVEQDGSYYFVMPVWKQTVDTIPWNSPEVKQIEANLKNQIAQKVYYDWYLNYKNSAKIVSHIDEIYLD